MCLPHAFLYLATLAVVLRLLVNVGIPLYVGKLDSRFNGRVYTCRVTSDELNTTPSWTKEMENPPLAARKAVAKAEGLVKELFKDTKKWELQRVYLEWAFGEKWYWIVEYTEKLEKDHGGVSSFRIIVLMDGSVPKPSIREEK
jgi:hypothetical protein